MDPALRRDAGSPAGRLGQRATGTEEAILDVVRRYWGFDALRPLQAEAIRASLEHRDSLVVLPTGGGKSLCYQVPPAVADRTDVVVSPLISLMKDQVDALTACGYPAAALHSGMTSEERAEAERLIASGECRLAFVAPERLVSGGFLSLARRLDIRSFAIDEAHCISHWGHAFRPEYRQLAILKERFPGASVHAFTATATERVRQDIVEQLRLEDPEVLVGRFDRPNLTYRIVPRVSARDQTLDVLGRHRGEAVIIYCISRQDTERLATFLRDRGVRADYYHAGMDADGRRRTHDAFSREQLDVIVATVAFGMGIDRSDVRCVIHAATPKSIEHYQQETGRAGRDGLEAECVLLHSPADMVRWRSLLERSTQGAQDVEAAGRDLEASLELLGHLRAFCAPGRCRHRSLTEYFGQTYDETSCKACDVCLGESGDLEDGTVPAQMILSCIARVEQRFGMGHIVDVLRGVSNDRTIGRGHEGLSTFGLMKDTPKRALVNMVHQLVDQDLVRRSGGDYPILTLTDASLEVMRGARKVQFLPTRSRSVKRTEKEGDAWEGVDRDLFERLRRLRTEIAAERNVPSFVVFSDASLRDMARLKPRTDAEFLGVHGVGERKLADLGERFLGAIRGEGDGDEVEGIDGSDGVDLAESS